MGRNWDIAKDTAKRTVSDLAGGAIAEVMLHHRDAELGDDLPKPKTPDKEYAVKTAAEHNDMPTVKSVVGAKKVPSYKDGTPYVPKTGPAILHEGERVVTKKDNTLMGIMDDVKNAIGGIKSTVDEYRNLPREYDSKMKMAIPAPKPAPTPILAPKPVDSGKRYGDRPGEKRLDSEGNEIPKYHKGVASVPKTGPAILKKGEAVIPAEKNPMNAMSAMEGITGAKAKPPKKIKSITHTKTDDGKIVHTHKHHHPEHHADETHVSNSMKEAQDHMAEQEPNMSAQPPEMPAPAPEGGATPAGSMPGAM